MSRIEGAWATWRGHITHVSSGRRQYIQDLDRISTFIVPYLEVMGVEFQAGWRLWSWLRGVRRRGAR